MNMGSGDKHKSVKRFYLLLLCALYASSAAHLYLVYGVAREPKSDKVYYRDTSSRSFDTMPEIYACAMFRIWPGDEFSMSYLDLLDWLGYVRWSGVKHIFLYDNCHVDSECQTNASALPYVTYIKWQSAHYASAQTSAIEHCLSNVRLTAPDAWALLCDIDEYPFSLKDKVANHLQRRILGFPNETSQILMRSMFFGGRGTERPKNRHVSLLEHYTHRHARPEGERHRTKQIFKAALAGREQGNIVHEMAMESGTTVVADPEDLRLNHYWGYRLDIPLSELVRDNLIVGWNA
jgi:hypothetical protein